MTVTGRARPPAGLGLTGSPVWPKVSAALCDGAVSVEVLPVDPSAGEECLRRLGVDTDSWIGALALHTGGVLIDHGWLRVYGGGSVARRMPDLAELNPDPADAPSLLVGADVLGGRYVIRGNDSDAQSLPGKPGDICYLGADTLRAEPLGWGYKDWLTLMVGGGISDFYHDLRWSGWESEVPTVPLDRLLNLYPPVYTRDGRARLDTAERTPVPSDELYGLLDELIAERAGPSAG